MCWNIVLTIIAVTGSILQYPPDVCSISAETPCWRQLLWPGASTVFTRCLFYQCWNTVLTIIAVTGSIPHYPPDVCSICAETTRWLQLLWPEASYSIHQTLVSSVLKHRADDYCCDREHPTVSTRRLFYQCWNTVLRAIALTGSFHSIHQMFVLSVLKHRAEGDCCDREHPTVFPSDDSSICTETIAVTESWIMTCCISSDLQTFGVPRRAMFALQCIASGCTIT